MAEPDVYSLTELADLAGVTPRTVRYYLSHGLLPAVGQSGPGSKYDEGHLARLRLIRRLQAEHLPLAEIRRRLEGLAEDAIRDLAGSQAPPPPLDSALDYVRDLLGGASGRAPRPPTTPREPPPPRMVAERPSSMPSPGSAPMPNRASEPEPTIAPIERSQWERIVLAPDVELHIRRPLQRAQNKQVDRLVTIARELLEEERP